MVAQLPTAEAEFLSDCRAQLATARRELEELVAAKGPRTVDTTLEMFNELPRNARKAGERANLWQEVHPDPKVRDAARTCEQEVQKFTSATLLDRRVFDAIAAVDVSKAD